VFACVGVVLIADPNNPPPEAAAQTGRDPPVDVSTCPAVPVPEAAIRFPVDEGRVRDVVPVGEATRETDVDDAPLNLSDPVDGRPIPFVPSIVVVIDVVLC